MKRTRHQHPKHLKQPEQPQRSLTRTAVSVVAGVMLATSFTAVPALAEEGADLEPAKTAAEQAVTAGLESTPAPVVVTTAASVPVEASAEPAAAEAAPDTTAAAEEGTTAESAASPEAEPAPAEATTTAEPAAEVAAEAAPAEVTAAEAATAADTIPAADVKLDGISFTRTDDTYEQTDPSMISMTDKRTFEVEVGVDGATTDQLQQLIDDGKATFSLTRTQEAADAVADPATYPNKYLGTTLDEWMTVSTSTAKSTNFFTDIQLAAVEDGGKSKLRLTFGNEYFFGMNGIDVRSRSTVRSEILNYLGTYQLRCDLDGQAVSTDVVLKPFDEYYTQAEIDEELPKLVAEANENGIYAKVEKFGTSADGRDMSVVFVAGSAQDLDDYQALKARMEEDPSGVLAEVKAGTLDYKVPIFYSNVHADELSAADGVIQFLKDLAENKPITYKRFESLTDAGLEELQKEMDLDGTVWSDLIKDKVTGIGYVRGNNGESNGYGTPYGTRSNAGLNDGSADLSDDQIAEYYNVVEQVFDPQEILKHVFFILVPSENVDARADDVRTNGNGFDLNRDNTFQTQPETQAMSGLITQWDPISLHEFHGFYQQFQIEPCSPTHDPNNEYDLFIDTAMAEGEYFASTALANNPTINSAQIPMRDYLKRQADGSVMWDYPFDDMSSSYTPQYAMMHGANAYTVELPVGNSDAVHAIAAGCIGNAQFVIDNLDHMFSNLLERYVRGVYNIDAETIRPYYVSQYDEAGAEADVFRPQDNENHNFFPEYYVIPMDAQSQEDRGSARDMVAYLLHNGVKVKQLDEETTVNGTTYAPGTIVVDMHQAKRNMANAALYPNLVISDWTAGSLYSEPISNFSDFRGFDMDTIRTVGAFSAASLSDVTEAPSVSTYVSGTGPVTVIRNDSLQSILAVNDLLKHGVQVGLITEGQHEGDYVVASSDFSKVSDKYVLYATQGTSTPTAKLIRNDIKVYVPKAYSDDTTSSVGMVGYSNRLNTSGNWDLFALATQMGFTLTDDLDEATIIVGSQSPYNAKDVAAKIKAGVPYIGYTTSALRFVQRNQLADIKYTSSRGGFDALDTVTFPEDSIVTATYRKEGDYIMYGYGGNYFVAVPEGAHVLIKTTTDQPIEGFMTTDWLEQYKGQIQAISILDDDVSMVLFANTLTNKAHQTDDYRYLTASLYSLSEGQEFPEVPVPAEPEVPGEPTGPEQPAGPTKQASTYVPKHMAKAPTVATTTIPAAGDRALVASDVAEIVFLALAGGSMLVLARRREQE